MHTRSETRNAEALFWTAEILNLADAWYFESENCGRAACAAACFYMHYKHCTETWITQ